MSKVRGSNISFLHCELRQQNFWQLLAHSCCEGTELFTSLRRICPRTQGPRCCFVALLRRSALSTSRIFAFWQSSPQKSSRTLFELFISSSCGGFATKDRVPAFPYRALNCIRVANHNTVQPASCCIHPGLCRGRARREMSGCAACSACQLMYMNSAWKSMQVPVLEDGSNKK